jgi:hypothetical protein
MYAFALLYQAFPDHPIWTNKKFKAAVTFLSTDEYVTGLERNCYGFPYNPAGFETAYTLQVFSAHACGPYINPSWWVAQQIARCYSIKHHMLNRNTTDPETLSARLYEATRIRNTELLRIS